MESLPIAGVDGTMRNRLTNAGAGGNAHIKTGTLRDVRAIAGYVGAANGESYVVVSMINDPRSEAARAAHDALARMGLRRRAPHGRDGLKATQRPRTRAMRALQAQANPRRKESQILLKIR